MTARVNGTLQGPWTLRKDQLWLGIETVDTKLARALSTGTVHEAERRIDRNRDEKPKKKDVERPNESENFKSKCGPTFYGLLWKITSFPTNAFYGDSFRDYYFVKRTTFSVLAMIGNWCYLPV